MEQTKSQMRWLQLFIKNGTVQNRKMTYTVWRLPGAGRLIDGVRLRSEALDQTPVNGSRNYNGPKVAKFLVG